jgi:enoyl-CoA hydratase/carnithine racemase
VTAAPLVAREATSWGVRLVLNRPDNLNASADLREELEAAIADAAADDTVRVIAAQAVEMGLDLQPFINMSETSRAFDDIVRHDGLKAALAWRDARYDERLRDAARGERQDPGR